MQENIPLVKLNKRIRFFTQENDKKNFREHLYIKNRDQKHKSILYSDFKHYQFFSIIDDDTKFGLFRIQIDTISTYNGKVPKSKIIQYLVYDKKKKQIRKSSGWYHLLLQPILEKDNLLNGHKFEWLLQSMNKYSLISILTVNILKKIYCGALTNSSDLFKAFLKEKGLSKISENEFLTGFKTFKQSYNHSDYGFLISYLKSASKYDRDIKFIENLIKAPHSIDLINLCKMTKTKINFSWSHKRLIALHDDLSKYVATIKSSNMKLDIIDYINDIPKDTFGSFKLLKTNKEYFIEGEQMNHCVFSNGYFGKAKNKKIFILQYIGEHGRGTAEIEYRLPWSINAPKIKQFFVNQFYGYGNGKIGKDDEAKTYLKTYLEREDVLDWWINEIGDNAEKQTNYQFALAEVNDNLPF